MNRIEDPASMSEWIEPNTLAESPRQKAWRLLKEIAPEIDTIEPRRWNQSPVPSAMSDAMFLSLLACLIDPRKRAILRKAFVDLIDDDLRQMILSFLTEESQ